MIDKYKSAVIGLEQTIKILQEENAKLKKFVQCEYLYDLINSGLTPRLLMSLDKLLAEIDGVRSLRGLAH